MRCEVFSWHFCKISLWNKTPQHLLAMFEMFFRVKLFPWPVFFFFCNFFQFFFCTIPWVIERTALSLSLSPSVTLYFSVSPASPWEVGGFIFHSYHPANLVGAFSDCFCISGGCGGRRISSYPEKREYRRSSSSSVAAWSWSHLSFSRRFTVSLSASICELCFHSPRNQKILKMIIAEVVRIPEIVTFRSSITPLWNKGRKERKKASEGATLAKKKKGKARVPQSFHPRKAPGILQVQAKTNTRALKSPVHNPCVITQASSPH